ncbi:hypothetical protein MRB53_006120 [Persea americana]|uniref:Uncharacterized protein n=1 Tax=Persea americana TaxID=3435 RepID=A0ACC2MGT2_PERAE|nr:hypothetical protein MRB53_006120 [Persea americana]
MVINFKDYYALVIFSHFPLPSEGGFLPFSLQSYLPTLALAVPPSITLVGCPQFCFYLITLRGWLVLAFQGSSLKLPRHGLSVLCGVEYQVGMPLKLSLHLQRVFHVFHERRGRSRSTAKAGLRQNNGFLPERGQALA